ncbi:unnamed protein product, partial [Nesidiocoris tenuis]
MLILLALTSGPSAFASVAFEDIWLFFYFSRLNRYYVSAGESVNENRQSGRGTSRPETVSQAFRAR